MKRIHLLPNLLTALSLTCGLFVIFKMNMIEFGWADEKILIVTAGMLLLAAVFDLLDGAVARAIKATSEFGGLFDSMADAITFGVAPSVVILKTLSVVPGTFLSFIIMTATLLFSVCGVMRLVRYNVQQGHEKDSQEDKKYFTGLPIPAACAGAVSLNLLLSSSDLQSFFNVSFTERLGLTATVLITLGYLMISRFKFPSFKHLQFRLQSFQMVFLVVMLAVMLFYGLVNHFPLVFFLLSWIYIGTSLTLSLLRLIAGRRLKQLEDFEPEPDELIE